MPGKYFSLGDLNRIKRETISYVDYYMNRREENYCKVLPGTLCKKSKEILQYFILPECQGFEKIFSSKRIG